MAERRAPGRPGHPGLVCRRRVRRLSVTLCFLVPDWLFMMNTRHQPRPGLRPVRIRRSTPNLLLAAGITVLTMALLAGVLG